MLEAVLLDVVAQAELERRVDLGLLRRDQLGQTRLHVADWSASELTSASVRTLRVEEAPSDCPPPEEPARSQSRSSGTNCAARASTSPLGPVTTLAPSRKTKLVLVADHVAECEGHAVGAGPLVDQPLTGHALAAVIRRGGGVDGRAPPATSSILGEAWVPDVLADREADQRPVDLDQHRVVARLEVASLVERRSWAGRTCGRCRAPLPSAATASEL